MKFKKTLACLFILAAFPLLASPNHNNPAPFALTALAGHTTQGGYACTCGCAGCICDAGESPMQCAQINNPTPKKSDGSFSQDASTVGAAPTSGFDFGSSALMMALAFFVWARFLRA